MSDSLSGSTGYEGDYNSLINHASSHDQQGVSNTALFLCQAVSSTMPHPMSNREWVTLLYLGIARQSHQSCLIPWPTASKWHHFISLPGSLISHASSHDQQGVSDITLFLCQAVSNHVSSCEQQTVSALFLCQAVSSVLSHPMTNRQWVTLLFFFAHDFTIP